MTVFFKQCRSLGTRFLNGYWFLLPLFLALCISLPVRAQAARKNSSPKWTFYQLKTKHYQSLTRQDPALCRRVSSHMEWLIGQYSRIFENLYTKPRARVTVLKNRADYRQYLARELGDIPEKTAGITRLMMDKKGPIIEMVSFQQPDLLRVLTHEGLHQFIMLHIPGDIPVWLNEGLACYFEENASYFEQAKTILTQRNERQGALLWLLNLDPPAFYQYSQKSYPLACTLVTYLANEDGKGKIAVSFRRFMSDIRNGKSVLGAFKKRFGNPKKVQDEWTAWLKN